MEVLLPADHSTIEYEPFRKNLYTPHPEVTNMKICTCRKMAVCLLRELDWIGLDTYIYIYGLWA